MAPRTSPIPPIDREGHLRYSGDVDTHQLGGVRRFRDSADVATKSRAL
jgi:hypothetical protein